jgi:uncharacterized membrane protein YphA (DoxX/SURF4 family)
MRRISCQGILLLVASVFLYAGISKLLDPVDFGRSIQRYQIIGHPLSLLAALWVPWVECVAALALFFKRWRPDASLILLGMLVVFEVMLGSAYLRDLDIDCGCFGKGSGQGVIFAFFRNLGLMAMLLLLLIVTQEGNEVS